MSAFPALVMGALCCTGGAIGFVRKRSVPSLAAGITVGALYLWSGESIRRHADNGLEGAIGASSLLLLASLPRITKGPIPLLLTVTSAAVGTYYGRTVYNLNKEHGTA